MRVWIKHIIWLIPYLLLGGCGLVENPEIPEEPVMVNLQLAVATSEMANLDKKTRTVTDADKEQFESTGIGEGMEELRIVIVNVADGVIEHNRYIPKDKLTADEEHKWEEFLVLPGKKRIYLFANENTIRLQGGIQSKLINYDFSKFSEETIKDVQVTLTEGTEEVLTTPLPMCECHEVEVRNSDEQYLLYITRVATKFTYRITNRTNVNLLLSEIKLPYMSRISYYLPKGLTYLEGGEMEVNDYDVPNIETNNYYTFSRKFTTEIKAGAENVDLSPFYLLETKYYKDVYNIEGNNYKTSIVLGGKKLEGILTGLPYQLPRNTHVVVDVIINGLESEDIVWEVDLQPYTTVELEPAFGLD